MLRTIYLSTVYILLLTIAFTAPPAPEPLWPFILDLFAFRAPDVWSAVVFNLMGMWPLILAAVLLLDGPSQRLPAWPFVLLSFAAGMFILMPYLLLRRFEAPPSDDARSWKRWLVHPAYAWMTVLGTAGLLGLGGFSGDWTAYAELLKHNGFVRTYSADFAAFVLVFPVLLAADLQRFKGPPSRLALAGLPVLGAALHLVLRKGVPRSK